MKTTVKTFFGVVDSNNNLVFESEHERTARCVSSYHEGSVVKQYGKKESIFSPEEKAEIEKLKGKQDQLANDLMVAIYGRVAVIVYCINNCTRNFFTTQFWGEKELKVGMYIENEDFKYYLVEILS